jgi:hypothetical protein
MKIVFTLIGATSILLSLVSCIATNNLYVNNPVPYGKDKAEFYVGVSTGVSARIDSVIEETGEIHFSNRISGSPLLSAGVQGGISNQTDLRMAIHFPAVSGSIGFRLGVQHSFFDLHSRINMAIGTDLGYVFTSDSINILGSETEIEKTANSALNADLFLPIGYRINDHFSIVITPRYSLNTIYVRKNNSEHSSFPFKFKYPALSFGIRLKKVYIELTTLSFRHHVRPYLGVAWLI